MSRSSRLLRETVLWAGAALGLLAVSVALLGLLFDVRPLVFRSGSMEPEISTGALAFAREMPASEVSDGDVVSVVNAAGHRVTHRVVSRGQDAEGEFLILKGDANESPDEEQYRVDSVYRVVFDVPWLGRAATAAASPIGWLASGAAVMLLLMVAFRGSGGASSPGRRRAPARSEGQDRRMQRTAAGGAVVALALTLGWSATHGEKTWAAFSDTASVTSGSFGALTVPNVGAVTCKTEGGILGAFSEAVMTWTSVGANYSYQVVVTTTSNGAAVGQTTVTSPTVALGTSLLGNLFSQNLTVTIKAFPTGVPSWVSATGATTLARSRTLGLGSQCGNL